MQSPIYYFSVFILLFLLPSQGGAATDVYDVSPALGEQYESKQDEYADLSVHFIAGTAFIAKVEAYDSNGSNYRRLGIYGVGGLWKGRLPVHSHLSVGIEGFLSSSCWFFDVDRATTATIHFWGSIFAPHFSIQGDAVSLGTTTSALSSHCFVPDYSPERTRETRETRETDTHGL